MLIITEIHATISSPKEFCKPLLYSYSTVRKNSIMDIISLFHDIWNSIVDLVSISTLNFWYWASRSSAQLGGEEGGLGGVSPIPTQLHGFWLRGRLATSLKEAPYLSKSSWNICHFYHQILQQSTRGFRVIFWLERYVFH